jgi:hypothetical protein
LTGRIRLLVDVAHDGNLADACRLTSVSYPTLNSLYTGASVGPNLRTLEAIASPYGITTSWFVDPDDPGVIPTVGELGLVPPDPTERKAKRSLRQVLIPFAAWPMFELFRDLTMRLGDMAATPERPIVGEAQPDALAFRLTTFLLQPLLTAERMGLAAVPTVGGASSEDGADALAPAWIAQLRALGEMWQPVLAQLLKPDAKI